MSGESTPRNPQNIWQSQKGEGVVMSLDDIRRKAGKFEHRIEWRNLREYVAALVVIVYFSFDFWHTPDRLTRTGFGLIVGGVCYVVWQLHKHGTARNLPEEMGFASSREFFRRELVRQRDLVGSVAKWYLGPMMPGWVVLMVALGRSNPGHLRHFSIFFTVFNLGAALFFVFVWWLNRRAARKLQTQIDALDALGGAS